MTTATFNKPKSGVRTIKQGDEDWFIHAGLTMYPRAYWGISNRCPANVKSLLMEAMSHDWLILSANVYEREITWEKLNETE